MNAKKRFIAFVKLLKTWGMTDNKGELYLQLNTACFQMLKQKCAEELDEEELSFLQLFCIPSTCGNYVLKFSREELETAFLGHCKAEKQELNAHLYQSDIGKIKGQLMKLANEGYANEVGIIIQEIELLVKQEVAFALANSKTRQYPYDLDAFADIMTVEEWLEAVSNGCFNQDDGVGYWVKDGKESKDQVFFTEPQDATHVAWYNK